MPVSKVIKCGSCSGSIAKTQGSIACKVCSRWIHASCANISDKDLLALRSMTLSIFICASCQSNLNNNSQQSDSAVADQIRGLVVKLDGFITKNETELLSIKTSLDDIKSEMSSCLMEMKSNIAECGSRVLSLEADNNVIHRRLNRANVVVAGLPEGIDDLVAVIIALGDFYKVSITRQDVHHVCYLHNKKQILVKFNSVFVRDEIMKEYFKTRNLKVGDLVRGDGNDLVNRVYLNDHFTPAASRLNAVCRKLLRLQVVKRFKVINADKLRAKLTLPNGNEVVRDALECASLLGDAS